MIRHAAGERKRGFHRIEAVHLRSVRLLVVDLSFRFAAGEEWSHRALGVGAGEIAIERKNTVGLGEIRHQLHTISKHTVVFSGERLVLIELRGWKLGGNFLRQAVAGRAVVGTEEKTDFGCLVGGDGRDDGVEFLAFGGFSGLEDLPRARGRVKIQDGGLRKGVGAFRIRMQIIRRELGRAALEGGDHQRRGTVGARHRGCVISRLAGDHPLGGLGVGDDVSFRAAAGGHAESGERGGCAHQFEERAARGLRVRFVGHFGGSLREFTIQPLTECRAVLKLPRTAPGNGGFAGGNFGVLPNALAHG